MPLPVTPVKGFEVGGSTRTLSMTAGFKFPSFYLPGSTPSLSNKKQKLLEAISYTANGKNATPDKQAEVLSIIGEIERDGIPGEDLLTNMKLANQLDGVWYLQWTSPSKVGDDDKFPDAWKPEFASENDTIETKQFKAKGSVVAAGIKVDTSNRTVKQIIDVVNSQVRNEIGFSFGTLTVGGPFKASDNVPRRAIVTFDKFRISFDRGIKLNLDFVFALLKAARGRQPGGWLETTYLDKQIRIGRGNKGTCFVLTRDLELVKP